MARATHLKRSLTLPMLTLYGLGNILGAGIYVLVGKVAGFAGYGVVLSFILAMVIAGLTAFSYMELAGRYPVSASVSVYLHKAFGRRWLSVLIGLAMVGGGITSAAALAHGFAGYVQTFIPIPGIVASIVLLIIIGLLAARGIGESAKVAGLFTLIEILGLALIIWAGRQYLALPELVGSLQVDSIFGVSGIILGSFLAFYAFIGFEDMVNVAEEVKNPRRKMPLAILISLIAATFLYLTVVVVAISVVGPTELAASSAPLSLVYERLNSLNPVLISAIGISAAVNGIVVQIIMGSRIIYGLAKRGWLHHELASIHKVRRTPLLATLLVTTLAIIFTIILPLVSLAELTSFLVLGVFALVNISLIKIKHMHPKPSGYISVPKVIPFLGAACCLGIIGYQLVNLVIR